MGLREVKKELNKLDKDKLIELVSDLYKKNKSVKNYFDFYISPDEEELLQKYKDKIFSCFYPIRGYALKINEAKSLISEFKKFSPSDDIVAELMLFYVQCGVDFTNDFGDIDGPFYSSLEKVYVDALSVLETSGHLDKYEGKANKICEESQGTGWGFGDYMMDVFYNYYPDSLEEHIDD